MRLAPLSLFKLKEVMPFAHHHRDSNAGLTGGHLLIHHTVLLFPGHGPHCGLMDLRQVRTQEQRKPTQPGIMEMPETMKEKGRGGDGMEERPSCLTFKHFKFKSELSGIPF